MKLPTIPPDQRFAHLFGAFSFGFTLFLITLLLGDLPIVLFPIVYLSFWTLASLGHGK